MASTSMAAGASPPVPPSVPPPTTAQAWRRDNTDGAGRLRGDPARTRKLIKTAAPVTVGERVQAAWYKDGYKGLLYAGVVTTINDNCTFGIQFLDGDSDAACPGKYVTRDNGDVLSSGAAPPARGSAAKRSKSAAEKKYEWRHDGIVACRYREGGPGESSAQRLMFDYDVSFKMHGKYVEQDEVYTISLHDMVTGDMEDEDKAMHVASLSDFMKHLLLTVPTEQGMYDLLESSGIDPMGPLSTEARAARDKIYAGFEASDQDEEPQ